MSIDRKRFLVLFAESPLFFLAASCAAKENTPSDKFKSIFDEVFKDLDKNGHGVESRLNNLNFTAQILRWSDGRQSGMDILFKGVRPAESVGIANYINKPEEVFVEDKNARTVVFGDGRFGKFALYTSGDGPVKMFSEGAAREVGPDWLDSTLSELKLHHRNRRSR